MDSALEKLIARHAVMEQITINMLVMLSDDFEEPQAFRTAFLEDVRRRLRHRLGGAQTSADVAFAKAALAFADELAPRIEAVAGEQSRH